MWQRTAPEGDEKSLTPQRTANLWVTRWYWFRGFFYGRQGCVYMYASNALFIAFFSRRVEGFFFYSQTAAFSRNISDIWKADISSTPSVDTAADRCPLACIDLPFRLTFFPCANQIIEFFTTATSCVYTDCGKSGHEVRFVRFLFVG